MQTSKKNLSDTQFEVQVVAGGDFLAKTKEHVLKDLAKSANLAGFRKGKAPLNLVEKNVDQTVLQRDFLDQAVNALYVEAITKEAVRPVAQPEINITKFVPFTVLEFTAKVEAVGEVKLPDYTKMKLAKKPVQAVSAKDVDVVLADLQTREATKKEVKRAAAAGDQVTIDFVGVDAKTKQPISGADGKSYPLVLGSNSFIPGFEPELIGLKTGDEKTFEVTFPKDYGVAALQSKQVTFTVTVHKVEELVAPKLDDAFAAKLGPFKTVDELKDDIKKQLTAERQNQSQREFENELIANISEKATVAVPQALIEEEIDRMEAEEKRNLMYRGQTWPEHLKEEGVSEQEHRERQRDVASSRVKSGLVLAEIAEKEKLQVTPEELDLRLQLLRGQYNDAQMQDELNKPEARREIANRLLSEKTIAQLTSYAT